MADLTKSLKTLQNKKVNKIPGSLGLTSTVIDVPGRPGYSFVRLLGNTSELIQAFNTVVASVYDLPVIVQWDGTKYVIIGRDINRYTNWGSSPYLPVHGATHQWGGGDPTWIFSEQFYPFCVSPSGSSVYIAPYTYNWNGNWINGGGIYTSGIVLPTGTSTQLIRLLYIDGPTAAPVWLTGGEAPLYSQKELLIPYLPTFNQSVGIPLAMVRFPSGTTSMDWTLLYDVRQWFMDGTSGTSGGGGGISEAPIDGTPYSRQDAGWVSSPTGLADAPSDGTTYGRKNAAWSPVSGSSGLSDAPSDGFLYGRLNAAWAKVTGSSGIEEAPINGNPYSRENGGWVVSPTGTSGLSDAPSDGGIYGRRNATWFAISGSSDASDVTYIPADSSDWDDNVDPGNVDAALDQLAERLSSVQTGVITRTPINITGSSSLLTDYTVRVAVEYNTQMKSNFDDIHFIDSTSVLLTHWREYYMDSERAVFWVKIPSIPAAPSVTTIYLICGDGSTNISDDSGALVTGADFDDATTTGLTINVAASGSATIPTITSQQMLGIRVDGFSKNPNNPVLPKRAGKWDSWGVRELSPVISDTDGRMVTESDGKIWAYYWGRDGASNPPAIGITKSADNGFTWGDRLDSAIISASGVTGSWYRTGILQGTVIKRMSDDMRLMMAQGYGSGSNDVSLGILTSPDGLNWTDGGQKLTLAQFDDGGTVITGMGVPAIIKRSSGDYLLIFEGEIPGTNLWRVFGATSSDFTGTWTPLNSGHPLMSPTGVGWESVGVANMHLVEVTPGNYLAMYNGIAAGAIWKLGFAMTSDADLTSWTRYAGNPVIIPGAVGTWDALHIESGFLVKENSSYLRIYYNGFAADGSHQEGMAIANQTRLLHAISAATGDGWVVGELIDETDPFSFELVVQDAIDSDNASNIDMGLFDFASVPNPTTNTLWNPQQRISISRTSKTTYGNVFTIGYVDTGDTHHNWDGSAWQTDVTYFGGTGIYKIKIWDDGTNYNLDILTYPDEVSILANVAVISKASVKAFSDGRVLALVEPYTNYYYLGQNFDNYALRKYSNPDPIVDLGIEEGVFATPLTIEEVDGSPSVSPVSKLIMPNGTLTNNGNGVVTYTPSGSNSLALDDLTDVNAPFPTDQDVLTWDDATNKWIAQAPTPGGTTGTSSELVLISEIEVGVGGAASIDFTSIPSTYRHLLIKYALRGVAAQTWEDLYIRFNNDNGGNYDYHKLISYATTVAGAEGFGKTSFEYAAQLAGATAGAGLFNMGKIEIPFYKNTNFNKEIIVEAGDKNGISTTNVAQRYYVGHWRSSAAINRITLYGAVGNLAQYSIASLYGML